MPGDALLSVNVSPDALANESVQRALKGDLAGVIVEVTEHAAADTPQLLRLIADLRDRGALIAVDDASTGYAGLLRLTKLRPDIVKLDRSLVSGVADNVEQSAVIEALVSLSRRIGARVLGEGVETLDDLIALAYLDVDYAQGFAIARPAARLPEVDSGAIGACLAARRAVLRSAGSALPDSSIDLQQITAALAGTVNISDLGATLLSAAASIGVDVIGLSTLDRGELREIAAAGSPIDRRNYLVRDFPATQAALVTGATIEAHLGDPLTDQAERILMQAQHLESVLITPLIRQGVPLGVLEFSHRSRKRWSTYEIKQARNLADHLTHVLFRLAGAERRPRMRDVYTAGFVCIAAAEA